jgi:hypothetical protein
MNGSDRDRRGSCADARVCSNQVITKHKKLLQWPASLEIVRYSGLTRRVTFCGDAWLKVRVR